MLLRPCQNTDPASFFPLLPQPFSNPLAGGAGEEEEAAANPLFMGSSGPAGRPATNTTFKPAGHK